MKKFDLGQFITVLANVGVIAGIGVLAFEIRQNTNMMRSQTRDAMTERQMMFSAWVVGSPELAAAIAKDDFESLTPAEQTMMSFHWVGIWREWENSHYQYRQGLFDEAEFAPRRQMWRNAMTPDKDAQTLWQQVRLSYSPEFRGEIDTILRERD